MSSKVNRRSQSFSSKPCPLCGKVVFQLEKIIVGDHTFHESCFVCCICQQRLTTGNYSEVDNKFYCPEHSTNLLREKQLCSAEPVDSDAPESPPHLDDNGCPLCRKSVVPGEGISLGDEDMVHKSCFVCSECSAPLTLGNFHALSDRLYCPTHFRQRKAEDGNGWKKHASTQLDADPLEDSLAALEDQEKQQAANRTRYITVPAQRTPPVDAEPQGVTTSSALPEGASPAEPTPEPIPEPTPAQEPTPTATTATEPEDVGKDQDNTRTLSQSETEDVDPSDDGLEKSEETKHPRIEPRATRRDTQEGDKEDKRSRRKRREGKLHRNTSETDSSGKAIRKRRKKSTEEVPLEHVPKLQRSVSKLKRTKRSEKGDKSEKSERSEKSGSVAEGDAAEDDKRKKSGKRGLFSLKKKNKKLTSSTADVTKDAPGSPSLTSFVSSRFRKKRDEAPSTPTKTNSAPTSRPSTRDRKATMTDADHDDLSDDLDDLGLEPLVENSPGQNRIGRLKQVDSPSTRKRASHEDTHSRFSPLSASKFKAPEPTPQKSLPIALQAPVTFTPCTILDSPVVALDEDLPIDALDLPKDSEEPNYVWSDYELKRNIPPMIVDLPDDVLPQPQDEKERIGQEGFFNPKVTTFGLIGVQRRVLELLALLYTTFPFTTQIAAATDISDSAYEILRERNGSVERMEFKALLARSDIDWVVVGCTYNNMVENITAAFEAGKNVFCEKPICFNTADFVKLKEAHAKSGKQFIGGSVWRKVPFYQEIQNILHTGFLGEIVSVEMNHLLEPSRSGRLMSDWTRQGRYCCTLLFDTFCFEMDVLNWLLGSLPSRVSAFAGSNIFLPKNKPNTEEELEPYLKWDTLPLDKSLASDHPFTTDRDVDDNHCIILEYRNKIRVSCHINTNCAFPQKRILICGLKGTLEGDLQTGVIRFKLIGDQEPMNEIRVSPGDTHGGADKTMMEDLIESVSLAECFPAEELFPSAITALGVEQAKKSGAVVNLEEQWKLLGL